MDDRLERALDFSNFRLTLHNQKQSAKQRAENMLQVQYSNSLFKADQTLINFVKTNI